MKNETKKVKNFIDIAGVKVHFIPVDLRIPFKFGSETATKVTCARTEFTVEGDSGKRVSGWGETPLSVQWVWPDSDLSYEDREKLLKRFCGRLAEEWSGTNTQGHPIEVGQSFLESKLGDLREEFNKEHVEPKGEAVPRLATLVCSSAFDIALHDAYGKLQEMPVYNTYNSEYMEHDLSHYLTPAENADVSFEGKFPGDFLRSSPKERVPVWHTIGGEDLLDSSELTGDEPDDGYPVLLRDWIDRDGLKCLKLKLEGNDAEWDYNRLVRIGKIGIEKEVNWLTADFNCTVRDPDYVNEILRRLMQEHPRIYGMILYIEQPFPYDLKEHRIDVHSISSHKPLFMDESAHDWKLVKLGRKLGWTGVALKTCKTQTGAMLSNAWAQAHGMSIMVQDLSNPMLAQIPHLLLAANVETLMGVETNSMQFYPRASEPEAEVHPGVYDRNEGEVDLSSIRGPGFGYRLGEIDRKLPEPEFSFGNS